MKKRTTFIFHLLLLQIVWWSTILSAVHLTPWICAVWIPVFLYLRMNDRVFTRDDQIAATALTLIGFILDTIWIHLGLIEYHVTWPLTVLCPLWLAILWFTVGFDFRHSLLWIGQRPIIGGIIAGLSGPSSYWGGAALGAVTIPEEKAIVFASLLFISWAVLFPLFAKWIIKTQSTAERSCLEPTE